MIQKKTAWIILAFWSVIIHAPAGFPYEARRSSAFQSHVPNEIIVRFKANGKRTAQHYTDRHNMVVKRRLAFIEADHVRLPEGMDMETALDILRHDADVLYAEPNYLRHALKRIPNDPFFDQLWGLDNVGQTVNNTAGNFNADINGPEAWDISTGGDVVIAVIDSGIDFLHPDLKNNLWTNAKEIPDNRKDDDGNGFSDDIHGWNFINYNPPNSKGSNNIIDSNHHGTHLSGIIAAQGNNGLGTSGVCWKAKIMALKFLDAFGEGNISDEIAAIDYAVQNGARIINASFGDYEFSQAEADAIKQAGNAGVLFVAAAGNDGNNNDSKPLYPAGYDIANIISVAATDPMDELATWSNFGFKTVDIAAPGVNIYAPQPGRENVWSEDFDQSLGGTWNLTAPWSHLWPTNNQSKIHSGDGALTTRPDDDLDRNVAATAAAPVIDLRNRSNSRLNFFLKRHSARGKDILSVQTATDPQGPWDQRPVEVRIPHLGTSETFRNGIDAGFTDWREALVDIGQLDGVARAYIRLTVLAENGMLADQDGWYIDDASISTSAKVYSGPETDYYRLMSGTSIAAPFVSGIAGLIWSRYPTLTCCQIKSAVLAGGDPQAGLSGKITYEKRVNALNSLTLAAEPSSLPELCSNSGGGNTGSQSNGSSGDKSSAPCFISLIAGSTCPLSPF